MTKVFIGGSRRVSRLSKHVQKELDHIIEKKFSILIGDANGADKAVQKYLHRKNYREVEVFCTEGNLRNNVGEWETRDIPPGTRKRDFNFYSKKDRAMAKEATSGLMIWDGKSIETLMNTYRIIRKEKEVVFYSALDKSFKFLNNIEKWNRFIEAIEELDEDIIHKFKKRIIKEEDSETPMLFSIKE